MSSSRVPIPGSNRNPLPEAALAPLDPTATVDATIVLRRRGELTGEDLRRGMSPAELAEKAGADPADADRVVAAVEAAGAHVDAVDLPSRRIRVSGTAAQMQTLFGADLTRATVVDQAGVGEFRHRSGELSVPADLEGVVTAVLGLDNRPQARALFRVSAASVSGTSYTPLDLARIYAMPAADGAGQTVAVIELGGGFSQSDLTTYFSGLGVRAPEVTAASVDGAVNVPGQAPTGADGEVLLDIEVVGAVAPAAHVVVYFAPNTDAGFLDAVSTAAHATPTPTAMSISWGQSEDAWTGQACSAMDAAFADACALGVTVTVASGDAGSSDKAGSARGAHVDFPASSPHVLACGGTHLVADAATGVVSSETVWNDGAGRGATGGGVSDVFPLPAWQASAGVPPSPTGRHRKATSGRGVPDVAGDADPETGYQVRVDGKDMVIGGTSAVAPLWAGFVCRLAQLRGKPFGLVQPDIYAGVTPGHGPAGFRDITTGSNGHWKAGPGWDPCTGLGTPAGTTLVRA